MGAVAQALLGTVPFVISSGHLSNPWFHSSSFCSRTHFHPSRIRIGHCGYYNSLHSWMLVKLLWCTWLQKGHVPHLHLLLPLPCAPQFSLQQQQQPPRVSLLREKNQPFTGKTRNCFSNGVVPWTGSLGPVNTREVVQLPLLNGNGSLDQSRQPGKKHQMPWPREGTWAPLEQFSENLCSTCRYTKNNKTGCWNNGGELEEIQCNGIIKINPVTLPEKNHEVQVTPSPKG